MKKEILLYAHVTKELIEQFGVFVLMCYIAICLACYMEYKNKILTEAKNAKYKRYINVHK